MKLVVIVGMAGSGKSFASNFFVSKGFERVYFGGIVLEETQKRGLEIREQNEKIAREDLRKQLGMGAIAILALPKIKKAFAAKNVVVDGLYSWAELVTLKKDFPGLELIAIFASPKTRHERLAERNERRLSAKECTARDKAEIENLEKGGPIAMADFIIINEGTKKAFEKELEKILKKLKK
jgi:dephospho-CoA kinase